MAITVHAQTSSRLMLRNRMEVQSSCATEAGLGDETGVLSHAESIRYVASLPGMQS
jgi:hypothetical protein